MRDLNFSNSVNRTYRRPHCRLNRLCKRHILQGLYFPCKEFWRLPLTVIYIMDHIENPWAKITCRSGYIHSAPFSFLSAFVCGNAICSVFKWMRYERNRHSVCCGEAVLLILLFLLATFISFIHFILLNHHIHFSIKD